MKARPKYYQEFKGKNPPAVRAEPSTIEQENAILQKVVRSAATQRVRGAARIAVCLLPVVFTEVQFFVQIKHVDGLAARDLRGNAGPLIKSLVEAKKLQRLNPLALRRGHAWGWKEHPKWVNVGRAA